MEAMKEALPPSGGSRKIAGAAACLIGLVLAVAIVVGDYAARNPNHITFGGWPVLSETAAAGAVVILARSGAANRRRPNVALFALGAVAATISVLLLGMVALVLSFNQL